MKNEKEILDDLIEISDKEYKEFHSKLSPETDKILGVRVPLLKKYAKQFLKNDDWQESFNNIGDSYNEEKMLKGIIIGMSKIEPQEKLNYLEQIIPCIDSWSACDIICGTMKFAKTSQELVWNFLEKYVKSEKEFEVRFAVVMYLGYFINDNYLDKVINELNNINRKEYYIKMAIAWAISIIIVKYPEKGMQYLKSEENKLDDFTYNMSIQKAIDSFRVSDDKKQELRGIKRR